MSTLLSKLLCKLLVAAVCKCYGILKCSRRLAKSLWLLIQNLVCKLRGWTITTTGRVPQESSDDASTATVRRTEFLATSSTPTQGQRDAGEVRLEEIVTEHPPYCICTTSTSRPGENNESPASIPKGDIPRMSFQTTGTYDQCLK